MARKKKNKLEKMLQGTTKADAVLVKYFGKSGYSVEEVNAITSQDSVLRVSKNIMKRMLSFGMSVPELKVSIQKELDDDIAAINGNSSTKCRCRGIL